ncbi:MAG: hypothetical protein R3A48_19960 [Polyangiales bacterium]
MSLRRCVLALSLLAACTRSTPAQPPRALDGGAAVVRDAPPRQDLIAPALLLRNRVDVPEAIAPIDTGPQEEMTSSAAGDSVRVAGRHFRLDVAVARASNATSGRVTYNLRGADGFTVNAGYPITIEASATALELDKTSLRRTDALTYTPQLARFEVAIRDAQRGETVVTELLFSVCRGQECEFESRRVVVVVP